jgi:hypothetical protein
VPLKVVFNNFIEVKPDIGILELYHCLQNVRIQWLHKSISLTTSSLKVIKMDGQILSHVT